MHVTPLPSCTSACLPACTGLAALVAALTQLQESHEHAQEQPQQGLQELLLHGCGIDASGVEALVSSSVPASLVHLDLAHNTELGPDAAQHLAALLSSAPKLETLRLQGTSIGDAGAAAVVAAVAGREGGGGSLMALDLSNTGCGQLAG
jgi:Ran GTPase-activating protein (RanGAP) involved in mRNA processing and transport